MLCQGYNGFNSCLLDSEDATEEVLTLLDREICRLRNWYQEKHAVYDKVVAWQKCWDEYLEVEVCFTSDCYRLLLSNISLFKVNRQIIDS